MKVLEVNTKRNLVIHNHTVHPENIEHIILSFPAVIDARVLMKQSQQKQNKKIPRLIAYIVINDDIDIDRLHQFIITQRPGKPVPDGYVCITRMPLDKQGHVHDASLESVSVIDDDLVQRWQDRLQRMSDTRHYALVKRDRSLQSQVLHLSQLCPQSPGKTHAKQMASPALKEGEASEVPAITDGGPLSIDASLPGTLSEALLRAQKHLSSGIVYVQQDGSDEFVSYSDLSIQASKIANGLTDRGLQAHDIVILQLEKLEDFIAAFWACLLAGITPLTVAIAPSYESKNGVLDKLFNAWLLLKQPVLICDDNLSLRLDNFQSLYAIEHLTKWSVSQLHQAKPASSLHQSQPDDIAFLQLSSGTTGVSKCIPETHRAVIAHIQAATQVNHYQCSDISLNWLPMDHVGPLLMYHVRDVYLGMRQIQVPTNLILNDPILWLDYLQHYQVSHTWCANFGYKRINDCLLKHPHKTWDLSCVKVFCNAGEQVTLPVVRDFLHLTKAFQLNTNAVQPAYGMAEAGTAVTFCNDFELTKHVYHIDKGSFQSHLFRVSQETENTSAFIVQGPPSPGVSIRIVDKKNHLLTENRIGRVQLKGMTIMPGYVHNDVANRQAFTEDDWYNTGDLGFLLDGQLTITGREKELIVIYGANYYCTDIESVVDEIAGVRATFVAAVGINTESDTEQLVIFFVPVRKDLQRNIDLLETIKTQVSLNLGVNPSLIIPITEVQFPKTTSGKVQRSKLKEQLLQGHYVDILADIDRLSHNENTLPNWFYQIRWVVKQTQLIRNNYPSGPYLIFMDEQGLGRYLAKELGKTHECILVESGNDYEQINRHQYRIDASNREHFHLLFSSLVSHHQKITQIVHLWNYKATENIRSLTDLEHSQKWVMCNFLLLSQSLIKYHDNEHNVQCYIITNDTQFINRDDKPFYDSSGLPGLIRTLSQEVPWLNCRHIDMAIANKEQNGQSILQEIKAICHEQEVAYRQKQRFVKRFKQPDFQPSRKTDLPFKSHGVYLISGGLGHVGLAVSQMLLERYQARLIIIGRSVIADTILTKQADKRIRQKQQAVEFLRQFDGAFVYHPVDVCDQQQLENIIQCAERNWHATLDGVIHLAGSKSQRLLKDETITTLSQVLRPKVMGAWVLHQLLLRRADNCADKRLFIHFSSVSSHFSSKKNGAEAAANTFLNSFSRYQNQHKAINSFCFAWSRWHESVQGKSTRNNPKTDPEFYEISQHQAIASLLVALHHQYPFLLIGVNGSSTRIAPQVLGSSDNKQELSVYFTNHSGGKRYLSYKQLNKLTIPDSYGVDSRCRPLRVQQLPLNDKGQVDFKQLLDEQVDKSVNHDRFVPPASETERQLACLWQDILSISRPGVHDNFFQLGGNSLLAIMFASRVHEQFHFELTVQHIFKSPTIAEVAKLLEKRKPRQDTPFPIQPRDSIHLPRLSIGQERLWFLFQLAPKNPQYNVPVSVDIQGDLNIIVLIKSLNKLIERHEILRTRFSYRNNQVVQHIADDFKLTISITDISAHQEQQQKQLEQLIYVQTLKPFDITNLPLIRVELYRLSEQHYVMLTVLHHIITDGWSMGILFHELTSLYKSIITNEPPSLAPLPIQYSDFSLWQRSWLSGARLKRQMDYWTEQLANLPVLNLLPNRPRTKSTLNKGARHYCYINSEQQLSLMTLAQEQEVSLFILLLTIFMILCARYSGQDDIAVGTGIANRNRTEIEPLIGFFTNTLVMRGDLSGEPDFISLLSAIKQMALEAYEHQDLPFGDLVDALQPQRDIAQNPLVQVMFVMQNNATPVSEISHLTFSPFRVVSGLVKMDIEVNVYETDQGLRIETEYNQGLFDATSMERMFRHYLIILDAVLEAPRQKVLQIPLLSRSEQQFLLFGSDNDNVKKPSIIPCMHQFVEHLAQKRPQAQAVCFEQQSLTYVMLNHKANQLARYLCTHGVQDETLVGICIERSIEMIIAILAIFKAGAAYVPLDPAYPEKRLRFILDDTALSIVVTQQSVQKKIPSTSVQRVCLDSQWPDIEHHSGTNIQKIIDTRQLAYVIYTSGSTGNPKGVLIEHRSLSNLIRAQDLILNLNSQKNDQILQFSSLNFDASVFEIVLALCSGACLHLVKQQSLMFGLPLLRLMEQRKISIALIPPSVLTTIPIESVDFLPDLHTLIVGGEPASSELLSRWSKDRRIFNAYGPTEATVVASMYLYNNEQHTPPIGRALINTAIYLLDKAGQVVPIGVPGEIHIGGIGVARAYLNQPDLTSERFISDPFAAQDDAKMYRSGDLGRYLENGNIEYLGRIDQQVKIRGFRVEPGEIESHLRAHEAIDAAFVDVNKYESNNPFLEAFVTQKSDRTIEHDELIAQLRAYLKETLPAHMLPSAIHVIDNIPLTVNGKLDYSQLSRDNMLDMTDELTESVPSDTESTDSVSGIVNYEQTQAIIIQVICRQLQLQKVSIHSHFFDELGANSLGMVHIHKQLEQQLHQKISLINLFEYPSIAQLTQYLVMGSDAFEQDQLLRKKMPERVNKKQTKAVAIIGMAGRFPGADNVETFWHNIKQGKELIQEFTREQLLDAGVDKSLIDDLNYVPRKGALDGVENFDAQFFNFTPKEASITDPQQRLFLEATWEAFEHAGYDPYNYPGTVGIMGGQGSTNTYYQKNLQFCDYSRDVVSDYQVNLNNSADFLCTRVAYKLNLQGLAATIQSACSTSLVPSIMGYQALINDQADLIVAGGSAISLPAKSGYLYQEGMILSPDGHCRTFDAAAQGTVPGNATGVVLLKRLEDAIRDGDTIYAIIRGAAFNNDGDRKVGFTASGLDGQTRVIREALKTANVSPESISYVEAHGTATPLGDPIEIRALTKAWYSHTHKNKKGYCAIGSVKTNIGHCDAAAGVSGLIKTVCSLYHKQIAPSLHFHSANPQIDFSNSPFYVNTKLCDWPTGDTFRRAAVSSFGMGGTNAHMILEEAPKRKISDPGKDWLLFISSAKTPTALQTMQQRLLAHLQTHPEQNPADVAYTAQVGRHAYQHRQFFICQNRSSTIRHLAKNTQLKIISGELRAEKTPKVIFVFPGQGAQYINMGKQLYHSELLFREQVDRCADILTPLLKQDIRSLLYPEHGQNTQVAQQQLKQTQNAQIVVFVIEYAMANLLMAWGIQPAMVAGHSLGEYSAACITGVMTLEQALRIVTTRARLMQAMPRGSMLAVPLSEQAIQAYLVSGVDMAAINSAERCVVSGPDLLIQDLKAQLRSHGIDARLLHTSHAYHSAMMEPMQASLHDALESINFKAPRVPLISSINGQPIQHMDRSYWVSQIRETVRFTNVLDTIYQIPNSIVLEIGPGNTLSSFARSYQHNANSRPVINTMRHATEKDSDIACLLRALGQLWVHGVSPDWQALYRGELRHRVAIPCYPFERKPYWVATPAPEECLKKNTALNKQADISDWFYVPTWQRTEQLSFLGTEFDKTLRWLVFVDQQGVAEHLIQYLQKHRQQVIVVSASTGFAQQGETIAINPASQTDYRKMMAAITEKGWRIDRIVHCWSLNKAQPDSSTQEQIHYYQHHGFNSLVYLLQAFDKNTQWSELLLQVVTDTLFAVTGTEHIEPAQATLLGAIKVIPQEYPQLRCYHNDIVLADWRKDADTIALSVLAEPVQECRLSAYRNGYRWTTAYDSLRLPIKQQGLRLKQQGVYLITGGLGGMGLTLAGYLAKNYRARLILLSRKQLPERHLWADWLQTHERQDVTSQAIGQIEQLENSGAQVLVVSADVSDYAQLQAALQQSLSRFGCVNGVIHAAGIAKVQMIDGLTAPIIEHSLVAKVQGTLLVHKVFGDQALDFMLLCSSLSTQLGGLGLSAYCAANAFLDTFALQHKKRHAYPIISLDWEGWSEVGMAVADQQLFASVNEFALSCAEGIQVFSRLINHDFPQIIISSADLTKRISDIARRLSAVSAPEAVQSIPPVTHSQSHPPTTPFEQAIADIWSDSLGIEQPGIHDDFFESGGDSLSAVQMISRLRDVLKLDLAPHSLIDHATINALAELMIQQQDTSQRLSPLLVPLKSIRSDQPPLFLIHPVGGSVYIYRDLASTIAGDVPIYGIQAQGWDGTAKPLTSIDDMARHYVTIIRQAQPEGPYQLGGASLGGVIAFEMAQQLLSQGETIDLLCMMDTPGTGHMPRDVFHNDVDILLYLLNLSNHANESFCEQLATLESDEQLQYFIDKQNNMNSPAFPDIEQLRHFLALFKINAQALQNYRSSHYQGSILFFVATEKDAVNSQNPQEAWAQVAEGGVEVVPVSGNHITMNYQPNVTTIAKRLEWVLAKHQKPSVCM